MKTENTKTENIHIRVSETEKQRLQTAASRRGLTSISELVRDAGKHDEQIEETVTWLADAYTSGKDLLVGAYLDQLFGVLTRAGIITADNRKSRNSFVREEVGWKKWTPT
jgi:hypothetical protein